MSRRGENTPGLNDWSAYVDGVRVFNHEDIMTTSKRLSGTSRFMWWVRNVHVRLKSARRFKAEGAR